MTLTDAGLAESFSRPVRQAGLEVQSMVVAEPFTVRLRVVDPRHDDRLVAVFEAAKNEYLSVTLDNGAHFWEHEWEESFRELLAAQYGAVVVEHLAGAGTFDKSGLRYAVTVDGEQIETRWPVEPGRILEL